MKSWRLLLLIPLIVGGVFSENSAWGFFTEVGQASGKIPAQITANAVENEGAWQYDASGYADASGGGSAWHSRFPGVQVRRFGDYWAKRSNPNSLPFMQRWGQYTIDLQADALERLRGTGSPVAGSRLFPSSRLVVEHVGEPLGYSQYLSPAYWGARLRDSRRLGTPFNDLRPGIYGEGFRAFDPAIDPIQAAIGIGGGTAIGVGVWWAQSLEEGP